MNLRVFDSEADLASAAAEQLMTRIAAGARTIGLSGGSTPHALYRLLGEKHHADLARQEVVWILEDERYVPPDHSESNGRMIEESLFAAGLPPSHRFLRFRTELNDPALTARDFEDQWRNLRLQRIDVVLLGIGEDGHTASLFPDTDILDVTDRVAREIFVPRLDAWRVTLTLPVLQSAAAKYVLASGASKKPVLEQVRLGADLPIVRVTRNDDNGWWFVDRDAYPDEVPSPGSRVPGQKKPKATRDPGPGTRDRKK